MKLGVSYFGNRMPRHFIERDLPELLEAGCTFVVHTFSEHDMEFYPRAIAEMVAASKAAGLEVYLDPWGVAGVFGGEAFSRFLLQHPEAWQEQRGLRIPMACPNAPALLDFMRQWVEAAAAVDPDVLFWDEPHFTPVNAPGQQRACRCGVCRRFYADHYGEPMPESEALDVRQFHEDSVVRFIGRMSEYAAALGLRNAVCLLPFSDEPQGLQHWETVAALPHVDVLGVTPFWHLRGQEVRSYVRQWATTVASLAESHGKEAQVWLQAFLIDLGREDELAVAAQEAYGSGVRNIAAWGFRACEHLDALRPDRPELVWQTVRESFAALRRHA
jgi:hypothetical protein